MFGEREAVWVGYWIIWWIVSGLVHLLRYEITDIFQKSSMEFQELLLLKSHLPSIPPPNHLITQIDDYLINLILINPWWDWKNQDSFTFLKLISLLEILLMQEIKNLLPFSSTFNHNKQLKMWKTFWPQKSQ